jgi:hypothetical protein
MNKVHNWGKAKHGNIPSEIKTTQKRLQILKSDIPNKATITQIHNLEDKLDGLLQKEEQWWYQRAKINWLQHGDKNSKFFHFKATQRQRKNKINFITDPLGNNQTQNKNIQEVFQNYFSDLFSSSNPTNMQETMQVVANRVHPQMTILARSLPLLKYHMQPINLRAMQPLAQMALMQISTNLIGTLLEEI